MVLAVPVAPPETVESLRSVADDVVAACRDYWKVGTPPRLDGRSIDTMRLEVQPGDEQPVPFSLMTEPELVVNATLAAAVGVAFAPDDLAAAIDAWDAWRPHLIWMDMRMPVMDGYEATRALRALPAGRALPVIALTAAALTSEREQAMACGMNGFLTKPIDAQKLHDTLVAALARSS